ncbi:hypothetical protein JW777_05650 [bacterium]|nr:hypothetical protein [bacterium]
MPVRITEISLKHVGPIENVTFKPGLLNCIFGRNERGKTYLVEFLVRSLFRGGREWRLRPARGAGRITVEGLSERPDVFSPTSAKKLEHFWDQGDSDLPPDFAKLLVVKGAETEFIRGEGGVDRSVIKAFLSGADSNERILNRVSKTVRATRFENRILVGPNQGERKDLGRIEEQLKELNTLFDQLDKGYSGGPRTLLSERKTEIEAEIAEQLRSKRREAYRLSEAIRITEEERSRIDEEALKSLRPKMHLLEQKRVDLERRQVQQREAERRSEHYDWLRSAKDAYRERMDRKPASVAGPLYFVLVCILMLASTTFITVRWTVPALITLLSATLLAYLYMKRLHDSVGQAPYNEETAGIRREFLVRFGQPLSGLPHLEEMIRKQEGDYNESRLLLRQIADEQTALAALEADVRARFVQLGMETENPGAWSRMLRRAEDKVQSLNRDLQEKKVLLARLAVDPSEYDRELASVPYDERRMEELRYRLKGVTHDLDEHNRKLDQLKQMICRQTGDDITRAWPDLITNLQRKREQVLSNYRDQYAAILGKIALTQVLEALDRSEDSRIRDGLDSNEVTGILRRLTVRYSRLRMEGDSLLVSDDHNEFPITELSTGAQEQTLLSLRIGFASRLLRQNRIFLLLDDAFQYSDWERRRSMVDAVAGLAEDGWQVLYFTMDDHLLGLFDERGQALGRNYSRLILR